ncbi:uncharacterized protein LOC143081758 [Mytilus galloprovincialis]|uniref:uncharacterized protein LOC143081758 n=1 Tax=Mytilus galloprovincialis TaxID=29158 RepID=UPI003F7C47A5
MIALELCTKYANIDVNLYISFCVEDIKTAGSADYIPYMVSLMEGVCKLEISRNESLFSNTSGNDGLSILDTILDLMCPNNCHNNGVCNKTECICDNGYIGFDCSMTLADAPKSITVPDDGLCGTKSRGCKKTNVFGVFNAPTVYCKLNHFTVGENGKQMSGTETFVSAVYSYENLISCEFPSTRRRRSTDNIPEGYDISLSFDQTNYGDTVSIIIYDDDCFTCNSTSIICIKLDSCSNFTTGTQSSTSQLNPATTKTNYVEMATQKAHDTESEESGMSPGIYGAIGGAIVLVTVIGVVIYKWGIRKQSGTKKILAEGIESITKGSNSGCSGTAPTATNFPTHYIREQSDLSFSWPESSRPNTPANLFLATSKKA